MYKSSMLWLLIMLCLALVGCQDSQSTTRQGNLLENLDEWESSSWNEEATIALDNELTLDANPSWRLNTEVGNDLRLTKAIQVYAGRYYRFSAKIKTEKVSGPVGANLSVYGTYNYSRQTITGDSDWVYVEQVFRALEDDELEFALRLGYWNATATGSAWFNDISLEELSSWNGDYQAIRKLPADPQYSTAPLRYFAFFVFVPFLYIYLAVLRQQELSQPLSNNEYSLTTVFKLGLLLLVALLLRMVFAGEMGYVPQLEFYQAWALSLANPFSSPVGSLSHVAELSGPLWLYWLSGVGTFVKANMLEASPLFTLLIKLPGIITEVILVYILLKRLLRQLPANQFWWQACFVAFNPAIIMVTVFLGQPLAVAALLVLLSITLLHDGKIKTAGMTFAAAIATNIFSVVLLPVALYLLIQNRLWKNSARFFLVTMGAACVLYLPMYGIFSDIQHATALQYIFSDARPPSFSLETLFLSSKGFVTFLGALLLVTGLAFVVLRFRGEKIYKYGEQFYILSLFSVLLAALILPWAQDLFLYFAIVLLVPLLTQGRYYRWAFLIISLLLFVKSVALFATAAPHSESVSNNAVMALLVPMTLLIIIMIGVGRHFGAYLNTNLFSQNKTEQQQFNGVINSLKSGVVTPFHMTKFDYIAVLAIWIAAFSLVLFNIGERIYPTNAYTVSASADSIEVDLGTPQPIKQIRVYAGANGAGAVRFENWDGEKWQSLWRSDNGHLSYHGNHEYRSTFKLFRKTINNRDPVQRLRLSVKGDGFNINEIAIIGFDGRPIVPEKIVLSSDVNKILEPGDHPLFDEQHTISDQYGYQAMTVWDEVFYARSAYDLLHGQIPYEKSHPPLGKSLIAIGIRIFDMTPLGWRVVDAFFVSLLPVLLFIGGRLLTGRRIGAYIAAILAVFEPMFFIHGRWANIDSFLVVFLTASLLTLYRWYSQGEGRIDRSNAGWLLAAGALFGVALSIKWSALFTGFAIFVFFVIAKSFEYTKASWRFQGWYAEPGNAVKRIALDTLWWAFCFVLVPIFIYYLSHVEFVPTMPGQPNIVTVAGFQAFVDQQLFVWGFHSGKNDTHGSSSLFITWPFMWQPVAMFSFGGVAEGMSSSLSMIGNPVIWWVGFVVMIGLGWVALAGRNKAIIFLAGIYFIQCLPWLLIGRTTFLYHYYSFLPFVILGIAYVISRLDFSKTWHKLLVGLYVAAVIAAFVAFYPLVTTTAVPVEYVDSLRLLPPWSVL